MEQDSRKQYIQSLVSLAVRDQAATEHTSTPAYILIFGKQSAADQWLALPTQTHLDHMGRGVCSQPAADQHLGINRDLHRFVLAMMAPRITLAVGVSL